jgi:uncharacterized protein (DUF1778 family)
MDRFRTSIGTQSGRTDEVCGSFNTSKRTTNTFTTNRRGYLKDNTENEEENVAVDQGGLIRQRMIGGMFTISIGISIIVGIAASKLSWCFAIPVCIFGGMSGMFLGVGIEWLRHRNDMEDAKAHLTLLNMKWTKECRRLVKKAIEDTHKECTGFAIESARAISNRVANRIIARHAKGLLIEEQRDATFRETNDIVNEELEAFQVSIRDESRIDEKT